ncbi:MAG: hypothetical protein ACREIS_00630 [Nitrospiraceae bacterium]
MATQDARSFNYLIVSDLHLQEADLNPAGRLFYFDQEFTHFLRYYRQSYEGRRRWKLIIDGDFIEFYLRIHEQPDPNDKLLKGTDLTRKDFRFFPGTEWRKSVWKLDRIVRSHQLLFIALARFILEDNEIYIVRGNHDLEFFWPEVQAHFRILLAQFHPVEVSYLDMKAIVEERLHFVPWFYFEKDLLYVEHGHQYDAYCSNAHNLWPVLPQKPNALELALSAFLLRYFNARVEHFEPATLENINSMPKYIRLLIRNNFRQLPALPFYWAGTIVRTLGKIRRVKPDLERAIQEQDMRIREELCEACGLSPATLDTLERLAHPPVLLRWRETVRTFGLDLLAGGLAAVAAGSGLAVASSNLWAKGTVAAATVLTILVLLGIYKRRLGGFNDHRNLREIARNIRDTLGCRYVVFGHSHDPDVHLLSDSGDQCYFNVGTWAPRGKQGQFVYLVIVREPTGALAHLMRWDRTREQPVELDQASYVKGSAEREAMIAGERSGER